jgi:excisionase family DNA binding protein
MKNPKTPSSQKSADILLTPQQFADRLGIALSTAYQWMNERRLPTVKIGSAIRVRESAVEKFMRSNERPALRQSVCGSTMGGAL